MSQRSFGQIKPNDSAQHGRAGQVSSPTKGRHYRFLGQRAWLMVLKGVHEFFGRDLFKRKGLFPLPLMWAGLGIPSNE